MFFSKIIVALSALASLGSTSPIDISSDKAACALAWIGSAWQIPSNIIPTSTVYYRADTRSPAEIQAVGGLWAKGYSNTDDQVTPDISLYNHVAGDYYSEFESAGTDGYVSFTWDYDVAEDWIYRSLCLRSPNRDVYIYGVKSYPNMIDVKSALWDYNPNPREREIAAIRGVPWEQIVGWTRYTPTARWDYAKGANESNSAYNKEKYQYQYASFCQYQLAGFPPHHSAWKEEPWMYYTTCNLQSKRDTDDNNGTTSSNSTCTPTMTNQEFAQEYIDSLNSTLISNTTST